MLDVIPHKQIPKQRLPLSQKTDKWGRTVIEYYTNTLLVESESSRKRKYIMNENYNLINGKLDERRLTKAFNPMSLEGEQVIVPTSDEVISIIKPALKTLIGEEYNRPFDYKVFVTNPDAISEKESNIRTQIEQRLLQLVLTPGISDEELQLKLQAIQQWKSFSAQDIRERAANHLVGHYWEMLDLRRIFSKGWKDVLAVAEEIYRIDLINGNPVVVRCNPLNIYTLRSAESTYIEDSDVIVEDSYMSPGSIIDEFFKELTPDEVTYIVGDNDYANSRIGGIVKPLKSWEIDSDSLIEIDKQYNIPIANRTRIFKTREGNVRVMRVYWKSLRKVGFLSYIDETTGEELERVVDENYPVNKSAGEKISWEWITEWWQGIRIGEKIFIKIKPCDIQRRDINNISISKPPYIGTVFNYNDREAQSITDELKPIQYDWTVFSKKVSLLWSRNLGKVVKIDISKIPDNMSLDEYFGWITSFGIIIEDPFKEGAKGQPSGQFQSGLNAVDLELSTSIQAALNYMLYLRELAEEVSGISRQRKGELMTSDGLGITQQGVLLSAKLTEELFQEHEYCKQRVLEALLETAKHSLRTRVNKKLQYVLDDLSYAVYDLDVEGLTDASYGIKIANSSRIMALEEQYKAVAQAALQAGTMTFSQYMDVSQVRSLSVKVAKMKAYEEAKTVAEQKQQEVESKAAIELQQLTLSERQKDREHELLLKQMDIQSKLQIAQMNNQTSLGNGQMKMYADTNKNGINDNIELSKQEMINKQKDQELIHKRNKWEDEKKIKAQEIELKRKQISKVNKTK